MIFLTECPIEWHSLHHHWISDWFNANLTQKYRSLNFIIDITILIHTNDVMSLILPKLSLCWTSWSDHLLELWLPESGSKSLNEVVIASFCCHLVGSLSPLVLHVQISTAPEKRSKPVSFRHTKLQSYHGAEYWHASGQPWNLKVYCTSELWLIFANLFHRFRLQIWYRINRALHSKDPKHTRD